MPPAILAGKNSIALVEEGFFAFETSKPKCRKQCRVMRKTSLRLDLDVQSRL